MSTSTLTDRQTFRALVADVAARAKARLSEAVNGRIESAARLVLLHDVMPQPDGTVLVGSSSDPMKTYLLTGSTCECQDFTRGQAPNGWCQHRIAAGIHKRVGEVLAAQAPAPVVPVPVEIEPFPDNDVEDVEPAAVPAAPAPQPPPLPEAPASVNVRLTIGGREVQLTLRDTDEARLLARLADVLQRFPVAQAASPPQAQLSPQQHNAAAMHRPITQTGWCAVHDVAMKWNNGRDGRKGWFSHRTAEGSWCKGR